MRFGIRRGILAAYLVVLALGVALSAFIYSSGNAVLEASRPFLRDDLPILFSAVIFIVALFVGFYVNAFIGDVQKRRRLALFAEKNPNPVLRLSLDGDVRYTNPATGTMLTKIGLDPAAPGLLLPPDLKARLARMRESATEFERWDYAVEEFTLGCGIHYLPRYRMFHAYISDITERKRAEQKLIFHAGHDALTGLPNRRRFHEMLEQAVSAATGGRHCAVLLLNLDRFGLINSSVGHVVGDRLLRSVAERLQRSIEECRGDGCVRGTLFRFEADTFCVLMTAIDCDQEPVTLAERIAENMAEPFYAGGHEFFVTASIGISVFPSDGEGALALVQKADTALQCAKRRGRNGHQSYTREMDARAAVSPSGLHPDRGGSARRQRPGAAASGAGNHRERRDAER